MLILPVLLAHIYGLL